MSTQYTTNAGIKMRRPCNNENLRRKLLSLKPGEVFEAHSEEEVRLAYSLSRTTKVTSGTRLQVRSIVPGKWEIQLVNLERRPSLFDKTHSKIGNMLPVNAPIIRPEPKPVAVTTEPVKQDVNDVKITSSTLLEFTALHTLMGELLERMKQQHEAQLKKEAASAMK